VHLTNHDGILRDSSELTLTGVTGVTFLLYNTELALKPAVPREDECSCDFSTGRIFISSATHILFLDFSPFTASDALLRTA
jgi:hypothetical protein